MKKKILFAFITTLFSISLYAQPLFNRAPLISTQAHGTSSIFAADIDGDGDMDVLSASSGDGKIAWYENTDGNGNFGPQQIITTSAYGALSVFATDLDGDGDKDVLYASYADSKIALRKYGWKWNF